MAGEYFEELRDKIVTAWKANAALVAAVSGGVYRTVVKASGASLPYCVFFVVADTPTLWASGDNTDKMLVQFSFWDDSPDDSTLNGIFEKHFAVFHNTTIAGTYAGYWFKYVQARGPFRDPDSQERKLTLQIDYEVQVTPI